MPFLKNKGITLRLTHWLDNFLLKDQCKISLVKVFLFCGFTSIKIDFIRSLVLQHRMNSS